MKEEKKKPSDYPLLVARVQAHQLAKFKRLGGAAWLRAIIEKTKEKRIEE